jgi:DNA-binding GntR family transcriptional regulator
MNEFALIRNRRSAACSELDGIAMTQVTVPYHQQAYEYVKMRILTLEYKPNQYINDAEIAQRLDISRTPVREAFHRLEHEGLLINEARRGWRVYSLSLEDIHEIFEIKLVLEGMIVRKAAECEDKQLRANLRGAIEKMHAAVGNDDADAWLEADVELHDILFQMVGNDRALRIVANLNDQWHRVRTGFIKTMQGRIARSTGEHEAFVHSILAGDGELAESQMCEHLNAVRDELTNVLNNMVLPFAQNGL